MKMHDGMAASSFVFVSPLGFLADYIKQRRTAQTHKFSSIFQLVFLNSDLCFSGESM